MSERNETEVEQAREEQAHYFDHALLDGLPEDVTHQAMRERCSRLWNQEGESHE